ncbi:hypothetical protein R1flu_006986 [Riccia fluitans]|uniref:Uncharacterized protein n=1 Tax=Riccia fluitans TaxID=41844 RepID=A0ABD1YXK3_9MARC
MDTTIESLRQLHPSALQDLPPFVDDYHPDSDLLLDWDIFITALAKSPRLSSGGPSAMVFELLQDCFTPEDLTSGFDLLFQLCSHIACGHLSSPVARILGVSRLLALEKDSGGASDRSRRDIVSSGGMFHISPVLRCVCSPL